MSVVSFALAVVFIISLDKLVNNLEPDQFKNLEEQFNDIELLVRKRVFCGGQKMAPHVNKWSPLDGAHE